jgi:hypothetical protein
MQLTSIYWAIMLVAISSIITFTFLPFIIVAVLCIVFFGSVGITMILIHSLMHKFHFCPLCGIFPIRIAKTTSNSS